MVWCVFMESVRLVCVSVVGGVSGEAGEFRSILHESLGLALGARAVRGLVGEGEERASVTATFLEPRSGHPLGAVLAENGIDIEPGEPLIIRRTLRVDGGSRAFINDQACSAAQIGRASCRERVCQ